jgi:hypothetical protein
MVPAGAAQRVTNGPAAVAPGAERGAYEWNSATWWPTPSAYQGTLTTLKGLGVNTLYVDITGAVGMLHSHSSALASFLSAFEQLVTEADADGFQVEALGGDPSWAAKHSTGPSGLLTVAQQITTALPAGALEGVQFDVEPWGLRGWHNHKAAYSKNWLTFLQSTVSTWQTDGLSGRLAFTVPYWFGAGGAAPKVSIGGQKNYPFPLALSILGPLASSAMNVMAYRNTTSGRNGSLALFEPNLQTDDTAGSHTELLFGQETGNASPAEVTFQGTSCAAFQSATGQITNALDGDTSFEGIAVDDVESLEALCPQ